MKYSKAGTVPVSEVPSLANSEARVAKVLNDKIKKYASKNFLGNAELVNARAVLANYNSRTRRPRFLNSPNVKKLRKLVGETNVTAGLFEQKKPGPAPKLRKVKTNFPPNIPALVAQNVVNIIQKINLTTAQAKKALTNVPPPVQAAALVKAKNVKPAALKAFNSNALALAIVQMVKVPPVVAAEALRRPKVAPVAAATLPAPDLANIIIAAIRNRTPVPPAARQAVAQRPEVRAELASQAENVGGRTSEKVMQLIGNALKKPSVPGPSFKFPSFKAPSFKAPSFKVPKWPWTGRQRPYVVYIWNGGIWVPVPPSDPIPQNTQTPPLNAPAPPQGTVPVQGPNGTVIGIPVEQVPAAATKQAGTQTQAPRTRNVTTTVTGGAAGAGGTGGGATVTFNPTITIGLNKLPQLAQQARTNPEKAQELQKVVNNLKRNLPPASETRKAVETLFKEPNKVPTASVVKQALKKSYKNMNFNELLAARKLGKNKPEINKHLREEVRTQIRRIGRLSSSERAWQYSALYKALPEGFAGRDEVERAIRQELRNFSRSRDPVEARRRLNNWRRNFGSSLPGRLRNEYNIQSRRALQNERNYARRYPNKYEKSLYPPLRANQPLRQQPLRQTNGGGAAPRVPMKQEGLLRQGGGNFGGAAPVPSQPLPPNQVQAINKVGGANAALATVAAVPGGAPQVALAAQALNETNGNRQKAMEIKGVEPAALNAVNKLGGPKNTGYILEGLNTLSRKTPKRRSSRVAKRVPTNIRITELNRVINAVKKRKLISLVAHNVTKTNIHANENRKKKYYKKVLKSNILRRPLAAKVRQAAKKKGAVKAKA